MKWTWATLSLQKKTNAATVRYLSASASVITASYRSYKKQAVSRSYDEAKQNLVQKSAQKQTHDAFCLNSLLKKALSARGQKATRR